MSTKKAKMRAIIMPPKIPNNIPRIHEPVSKDADTAQKAAVVSIPSKEILNTSTW